MSYTFSFVKAAAVATVASTLVSSAAQAALTIDLRFADGTHTKSIAANDTTPITINAWALVTGAAGNAAEEGMQSAMIALKSGVVNAGFAGSITSAALATGWNGSGSGLGTASNLSADSIGDWGNASNNTITSGISSFYRVRTNKSADNQIDWGDANSAGVFNNLADGGVEFLVGSFTFTPTAATAGASLQYIPVVPLGGTTAPSGWFEDTADKTAAAPTGARSQATGVFGPGTPNASNTNAVTLNVTGVPEPTTLGMLGLGALGLIRRRRA